MEENELNINWKTKYSHANPMIIISNIQFFEDTHSDSSFIFL